jgi:hypothetical protein
MSAVTDFPREVFKITIGVAATILLKRCNLHEGDIHLLLSSLGSGLKEIRDGKKLLWR